MEELITKIERMTADQLAIFMREASRIIEEQQREQATDLDDPQ